MNRSHLTKAIAAQGQRWAHKPIEFPELAYRGAKLLKRTRLTVLKRLGEKGYLVSESRL